jgi:hypothetical protein
MRLVLVRIQANGALAVVELVREIKSLLVHQKFVDFPANDDQNGHGNDDANSDDETDADGVHLGRY